MVEVRMGYPCSVCGGELQERDVTTICSFCGGESAVDYICPRGHAICEPCQLAAPQEVVLRVCAGTRERDAGRIAERVMRHPAVVMHGPVHHGMVAPVALAALRNTGATSVPPACLKATMKRTADVPVAACATRGACGAASGVGALVSTLIGATYLKDRERSLTLRATAEALLALAEAGGPRCCKESVYLSLEVAAEFLQRELEIELPVTARCTLRWSAASHRPPSSSRERRRDASRSG
jgi:hypothetical protein